MHFKSEIKKNAYHRVGAFKSFYVCTEHEFIDHIIVPLCHQS